MKYRTRFSINALISALLGLGFLILPSIVLDRLGVDKYAEARLICEFFGIALLGLGVLLWFAKDVAKADLQKGMGSAQLIGAAAGLIVPALETEHRYFALKLAARPTDLCKFGCGKCLHSVSESEKLSRG